MLKGLGVAILIVIALLAASAAWIASRINREIVTPLTIANPDGTAGTALMVLSPGMSAFPEKVVTAFGEGLLAKGWRVERTTASREATAEIGRYDLVVLASPVYGDATAAPLQAYVRRVADFGGKPVVLLLTGAGNTAAAIENTEALVGDAGGRIAGAFGYFALRPNDEAGRYTGSNTERAAKMARDAALAIADGGR